MKDQKLKNRKIFLFIEGLDCQDEARIIRNRLNALSGIKEYRIDLMKGGVELVYQPEVISIDKIIKAIDETGMKARLKGREKGKIESWWQDKRVLFIIACGILTFIAFILHRAGLSERVTTFVYLMAIVIGIYYPARIGLLAVKSFSLNIYTLLVVAVAGALGLALWEEAAILVFIYSLGALLETYSTSKTRKAIVALMDLMPEQALVRRDGEERLLPVEEIKIGDTIIIKPGERIPLDGEVISGYSAVDESPVTGESIPVEKACGDEIYAGSINKTGSLEVRVTKSSRDTTLARIIHYVEEAETRKSRYQRFGERFGKYYTPITFILAILVASIPPLIFSQPFSVWFYRALVLLVVSCSCGLALSVPITVVSAITRGARQGILIKGGAYLEAASGLNVIAFDKTGTLTIGSPRVCEVIAFGNRDENDVLRIAASIEARSEHPLAEAIGREAKDKGLPLYRVEEFEAMPGKGIKGKINGREFIIGSRKLFAEGTLYNDKLKPGVEFRESKEIPVRGNVLTEAINKDLERLEKEGKTTLLIGDKKEIIGIIAVADQIRPEAKETVKQLKGWGYKIVMLTGDNPIAARVVAEDAGIDEFRADLLPEDKIRIVRELKESYGKIAFVGDGVNDAPAMAEADVGIAMGACGTDVAIETGDIVLMSDDLLKLPVVLDLSKKSIRVIKQNIGASLAIVAFLIPAALSGIISLVPGLLLNEIGALIVIANGLRLLRSPGGNSRSIQK